ncbi:TetR family transcriptional regulator [Jatrophihabitans sp. GAS493]|uniref:TetR/AcrR family transcriptional regulator n=1 Tax=Jatrophihabitans sp. GAS493 TaxID=1907575 RepID=UPI000BB9184B|nr:TetR/AcrR family transcriptional regulator [Jatrophihabitans sp. GAS493]SOD71283.1 TetR family transcriptional regulator [Jatrophihabitans sp. GAS493]
MTTAKRVRLAPEERRAQLIALGLQMLATRPLEELSVEELADQAGISRGLLFHYFNSKQEFHLAVATEAARHMLEVTAPDPDLPAEQRLVTSLGKMIDYVTENSDTYISLVRGAASGDDELRALFDATRSANANRILQSAPEFGVTPTPEVELAVHGWVAFAEEVIVRWLRAGQPGVTSREQLMQLLANALFALAGAANV